MTKIIIAVDGYSACGKSTLARELARRLTYLYLDTGAMYRAVTYYFLEHRVDWTDADKTEEALEKINIHFQRDPKTGYDAVYLNNIQVETEIRSMAVADRVSEVAAVSMVRKTLVLQQRAIGRNKGIVMDGRDIGTVVFPQAELKLFVTARLDIRINRRLRELKDKGIRIEREDIARNIAKRDHEETGRLESPLVKAGDALVFDTSDLTKDQMIARAYALAVGRIDKLS